MMNLQLETAPEHSGAARKNVARLSPLLPAVGVLGLVCFVFLSGCASSSNTSRPHSIEIGDVPIAPPYYPQQALKKGWSGTVILRAQVGTNGVAHSIVVAQSSGHKVLDDAAKKAVANAAFPQEYTGSITIPITFILGE